MTFTNPHPHRWDWSSEKWRWETLSSSYRVTADKIHGLFYCSFDDCQRDPLKKKTLKWAVSSSEQEVRGSLSVLKLWNHTPTTLPSSLHRSSSKALEKNTVSLWFKLLKSSDTIIRSAFKGNRKYITAPRKKKYTCRRQQKQRMHHLNHLFGRQLHLHPLPRRRNKWSKTTLIRNKCFNNEKSLTHYTSYRYRKRENTRQINNFFYKPLVSKSKNIQKIASS